MCREGFFVSVYKIFYIDSCDMYTVCNVVGVVFIAG